MLITNANGEPNPQKLPVADRNLIISSSTHSFCDLYLFVPWGQKTGNTNTKYYTSEGGQ